jgi:hypothetical protein
MHQASGDSYGGIAWPHRLAQKPRLDRSSGHRRPAHEKSDYQTRHTRHDSSLAESNGDADFEIAFFGLF